ncbi:MAG: UPF0175 family protein [Candidatus Brocadia sp.]|nr:UPF0175 family protein [Candidatus Brocadia sp.]
MNGKRKNNNRYPCRNLTYSGKKRKDIPSKIFEYLVLELYRIGEISSGKAAQFLEMERFEFIKFASRMGIPFIDMDKEELLDDYKYASRAIKSKMIIVSNGKPKL